MTNLYIGILAAIIVLIFSIYSYFLNKRRVSQINDLNNRLTEMELRLVVRVEDRLSCVEDDIERLQSKDAI